MKKLTTIFLAGTMILAVGAISCGCDFGGTKEKETASVESLYGIGAVTTAKLLGESDIEAKPLAAVLAAETGPAENDPVYDLPESGNASTDRAQGEAETFNKYFNMLEGFLEKGATTSRAVENDASDPSLAAYTTKLIVTGKNERGEENVHTLYYTETKLDVFNDPDDDDDDEVKTVEAWSLEGVLEMGTDENGSPLYYFMTGSRKTETETEGRESEEKSELLIRAYADRNDKRNYVMMKHETETETEGSKNEAETEYVYSVYRDGKLVESTSVDFETENAEAEYELEYTKDGVRSFYEIERKERGGSVWLEVAYNIGGERGSFVIVRDENGNFDYKYTKNSSDDRYFDRYDG